MFHWFEMCDAVQDESYVIDGVRVSNFVLPCPSPAAPSGAAGRDFLGTLTKGKTLRW